jgi:hypothetical protein
MKLRLFLIPALMSLIATVPAMADDFPFEGKWTITGSVAGPWAIASNAMITDDQTTYDGKVVTIHPASIAGPALIGCGDTEITVETIPFAGLFDGGLASDLKDPEASYDEVRARTLATRLGFTKEPVPTLYQGCSEIAFHLRDAKTLMFSLDDRIFTLKKM